MTERAETTLVVIDDDPDVLRATARVLTQAGYDVVTGESAAQAIELTRRHRPAILVLDVMLPDGNGVDVARQLKSEPALVGTCIILVSGFKTSGEDQAAGLDAGLADGYIARPFSKPEFLARIDAMLRLRAAQESLREALSSQQKLTEQVHHLAYYDALTNLPNRSLLNDRLSQAMALSKRSGRHCALMFLDLDNFKSLNDTHGHEAGDLLLIEASTRLRTCVRDIDTVSRFGGDEFVVLLGELDSDKTESARQAAEVAEKIRASLGAPYRLTLREDGQAGVEVKHRCSASIGVALFLDHEAIQADLLKWADAAMYQAKDAGRNLVRFYEATKLS